MSYLRNVVYTRSQTIIERSIGLDSREALPLVITHTGMPPNDIHNSTFLTTLTFIDFYSW